MLHVSSFPFILALAYDGLGVVACAFGALARAERTSNTAWSPAKRSVIQLTWGVPWPV